MCAQEGSPKSTSKGTRELQRGRECRYFKRQFWSSCEAIILQNNLKVLNGVLKKSPKGILKQTHKGSKNKFPRGSLNKNREPMSALRSALLFEDPEAHPEEHPEENLKGNHKATLEGNPGGTLKSIKTLNGIPSA